MKVNGEMIKGMQAKSEIKESEQVQNKSTDSKSIQNNESSAGKSGYSAINKDGDTLEITDDTNSEIGRGIKSASAVKLTDAVLTQYSSGKLKQLLSQGQISRQQFEMAMKKRQS